MRLDQPAGLLWLTLICFVPPALSILQFGDSATESGYDFDWAAINPSKELKYHKCYGSFECARLEVPLDWSNSSNPNTAAIAITRLPAVTDISHESFGGTIVLNPGGPSGSGVSIVVMSGQSLQWVVDSEKHFEILSFDPRGVQFTTPTLNCFQNPEVRATLTLLGAGAGSLESNDNALDTKWSIEKSLAQLCAQTNNGRFEDGTNIRQFVSTALVAQDMIAIVDQVEAHRQKALKAQRRSSQQQTAVVAEADSEPALLNYWGLSYGTYLGNTFASMFPHRIGRMILDGVVDAPDYAAGGWSTNLQDNNKTWGKFFEYCYGAGSRCLLMSPSVRSEVDLKDKVEAFLAELQHNPLPLVQDGNAYVLTYLNMKVIIHTLLYAPIQYWAMLATLLRAMMERNAEQVVSVFSQFSEVQAATVNRHFSPTLPTIPMLPPLWGSASAHSTSIPGIYHWQPEAAVSILCGDSDFALTSRTKPDYLEYLALLESQSPLVGSVWAEITLPCIHWPKTSRPSDANRFTGPFRSNLSDYDPRASPLLFIGNTADPVTPLRNAHKMSLEHEGSVVFTQDMPGHCAGAGNPSKCVFGVVSAFFANGTLPKPGLVCDALLKPWD
jgi:pimeloyl-ACP methyl ester carboxylesterase